MAERRHERSRARCAAVQLLYSSELTNTAPEEIINNGSLLDEDGIFGDYAQMLVCGVENNKREIDCHLVDASENWTLSRMSIVDRSILRLAVYEMLFVEGVPLSVSIDEAVELAKAFGGEDDSHRFVNGVLGKIARQITGGSDTSSLFEGSLQSDAQKASSLCHAGIPEEDTKDFEGESEGYAVSHSSDDISAETEGALP